MIVDLSCPIEMRSYELLKDDMGSTRAYIRLFNLSNTAIHGYAATINWFNEFTQASETENITVDEMRVEGRSAFKLVHSTQCALNVDHVEMYFSWVEFADGTRWTPEDGDVVDIGEQRVVTGEELDLLKSAAGEDAVQFPQVQSKYWRCVCGRINSLEAENCLRCGRERNDVLKNLTRKAVVGQRAPRAHRPPRTEYVQQKRQKRKSDAFFKVILIALLIILCALVGFTLGRGGMDSLSWPTEPTEPPSYSDPATVNAYSPYFSSNIPS